MITRKVQANKKWSQLFVTPSALLLLLFSFPTFAETSFSYQGRLSQSGEPANGIYDMRFNLFDAVTAGSLIGPTVNQTGVKVLDGVFNVMLDFGEAPFGSEPRWLRIEVKDAGGGAYVVLFPRQRVGASPFAIETLSVAANAVDTAAIQNGAVTRNKLSADVISTHQIEDGTITPADVASGFLLASKSQIYLVQGDLETVQPNSSRSARTNCTDANDIPLAYFCEIDTTTHLLVLRESRQEDWNSLTHEAVAVCQYSNQHPDLAANVFVEIACISVP